MTFALLPMFLIPRHFAYIWLRDGLSDATHNVRLTRARVSAPCPGLFVISKNSYEEIEPPSDRVPCLYHVLLHIYLHMVIANAFNPGKRDVGPRSARQRGGFEICNPSHRQHSHHKLDRLQLQGCARWAGEIHQKIAQPSRPRPWMPQ